MPQAEPSNKLQKIFNVCLVLMIFFFCANLILGGSLKTLHRDIAVLTEFLSNAERVKPNFEESLNLYTQGTQESIAYVDTLRPDTETEYIQFISSVEAIGQNLSLHLELESLDADEDKKEEALNYRIRFFGGQLDLIRFLEELEALPYYIRVNSVQYEDLEELSRTNEDTPTNIVLTIQLYVK
ncbi:MAG: hypothetical protein AAB383_06790 [Patescibacteria group bacterium]